MQLSRKPPSQSCYEDLRRLLTYSQIPPGSRIGEVEWSQRLGTHRPALREAMGLLIHEGLLVRGARGGVFVPLLEQRDFEEIREARVAIEAGAIRLIQKRELDARALSPLTDLCDTMAHLLAAGIVLGFVEADHRFHEALVRLSDNARLMRMYQHAALPFLMGHSPGPQIMRGEGAQTVAEHREIHHLLVERRYPDAINVLEAHLSASHRLAAVG